jgi:CRISPR-associated protein Csm5
MNAFLQTYRLALTPLSPIHIGCGEDFEPTNYVIDDGVLYGFDPSRAVLNAPQTTKLMDAANRASLLGIQKFFKDNAATFKAQADTLIPVSSGVAAVYEQRVGRAANVEASGNQVFNQLFIERTMHTGRQSQPYIPGSSFKGAIRTAMLDHLNRERKPVLEDNVQKGTPKLEARLLGHGDEPKKFERSPLRLLKIADLMPSAHCEPARRVMFGVNRKKKQVVKDGRELQPKGIAARKECILHGQFRAFLADVVLPSLDPHTNSKTTPSPTLRPVDFKAIAKQSNAYNQQRLRRELSILDGRGLVNPEWKRSIDKLLAGALGKKLSSGDAFLIRLGRYGGAESKTLTGEGVASIKIMGGRVDGKQQFTFEDATKTVWLAAEREDEQKHLLPFGWAVVEIEPQDGDSPELEAWCVAQAQGRPDMTKIRQQFEAEKQAAVTLKAELAAQATQREAARLAELFAAAQREQALAQMTEQCQQIETLRQKCEELDKRITGGNFKKHVYSAGNPGPLYLEATKLIKQANETTDWSAQEKVVLADMLEQWLPKVITPWDGKDQRKKLKLATLRGLA